MTPPGHIALGYLVCRLRQGPVASGDVAIIALFALLPDIFDKTLYYGLDMFASGRTVFHNVFMLAVAVLAWKYGKHKWVVVAAIGISTHILSDFACSLVGSFLFDYSDVPNWSSYILFPIHDPTLKKKWVLTWLNFAVESPIILLSIVFWWRDGRLILSRYIIRGDKTKL